MSTFDKRTQNYLTDSDIKKLVSKGSLFINETFSEKQLTGCAYDLRAGKNFTSRNRELPNEIGAEGYVVQPGEIITVQTLENVDLSNPLLLGLIVNSHTQLSQGLFHPITTIDPGFKGHLAITLLNLGNTGYRLRAGERIAKVLFCPISPRPELIYGEKYRPRVLEGSLEHSLYVEKHKLEKIPSSQLGEYFGGPLADLVERVEKLENDAGLYRTEQKIKLYHLIVKTVWMVIAGAIGAIIVKNWDYIWTAIQNLVNK